MKKDLNLILNSRQINQKIYRMAHHIYENHYKAEKLILVGIADKGIPLTNKIAEVLKDISSIAIEVYTIRINKDKPLKDEIEFDGDSVDLKNQVVILIDDVLNSGRTMMYAMKHMLDAGPKNIATAVLIERFYRRFPVHADYVGLTLSTNLKEHVLVDFTKGKEGVYLE